MSLAGKLKCGEKDQKKLCCQQVGSADLACARPLTLLIYGTLRDPQQSSEGATLKIRKGVSKSPGRSVVLRCGSITPDMLDKMTVGDCRLSSVLLEADIGKYRAILLVTGNDRVNYEAAFEARSVNPDIRLVIRSAKDNFNDLLSTELGNFVAFEPTELSAPAFVQAALGDQVPAEYPDPVYLHQGHMIVNTLRKNMVDAELLGIQNKMRH